MRLRPPRGAGLALLAGLALSATGALAQATDPADDNEVHINFEDRPVDGPPPSFDTALTGKGGPVRWELLEDESAPNGPMVLAETSGDRTSNRFPLAICKRRREDPSLKRPGCPAAAAAMRQSPPVRPNRMLASAASETKSKVMLKKTMSAG